MSLQPLTVPFLLFYFSSRFSEEQNPCLYIFPLHLLISCPQYSNLSPVMSSFKDLNCPNCFLNPSLDVTWYKTKVIMVVMCSLPQPHTIYLVLQLGIEYPPRDPGWCYPKVWEVFTGFPRGTIEPKSHFLLPPSQAIESLLPKTDSQHSQQVSSLGLETPKLWGRKRNLSIG